MNPFEIGRVINYLIYEANCCVRDELIELGKSVEVSIGDDDMPRIKLRLARVDRVMKARDDLERICCTLIQDYKTDDGDLKNDLDPENVKVELL